MTGTVVGQDGQGDETGRKRTVKEDGGCRRRVLCLASDGLPA